MSEWLLDSALLVMKFVEGEATSSFCFGLTQETPFQLEFVSKNFQIIFPAYLQVAHLLFILYCAGMQRSALYPTNIRPMKN